MPFLTHHLVPSNDPFCNSIVILHIVVANLIDLALDLQLFAVIHLFKIKS